MKRMWVLGLLTLSVGAFAGTTRGYLAENNRLQFYAGLDNNDGDFQLAVQFFSQSQQQTMWACMRRRDTHAIQVTSHEVKRRVPTDIPGRDTFSHETVIDSVKCVSAPGFLGHWRAQFHR